MVSNNPVPTSSNVEKSQPAPRVSGSYDKKARKANIKLIIPHQTPFVQPQLDRRGMIDPLSLNHYMTIISTADEGKKLSRYFREGCWSFFLSYFLSSSLSFFLEAVQPSLAK